jgi:D-glycero-alpha-D-manno-heptose-7-phosphate kinase
MILSKTPLRISFAGGGSDYFNKKSNISGRVISTTINKYIYILLNNKHDGKIRISYSLTENVNNTNDISHVIIRNSLKYFKIYRGVEIITSADVPSSGSGLGSSSALTVGLSNAINK